MIVCIVVCFLFGVEPKNGYSTAKIFLIFPAVNSKRETKFIFKSQAKQDFSLQLLIVNSHKVYIGNSTASMVVEI
jgi:hypothetical protein